MNAFFVRQERLALPLAFGLRQRSVRERGVAGRSGASRRLALHAGDRAGGSEQATARPTYFFRCLFFFPPLSACGWTVGGTVWSSGGEVCRGCARACGWTLMGVASWRCQVSLWIPAGPVGAGVYLGACNAFAAAAGRLWGTGSSPFLGGCRQVLVAHWFAAWSGTAVGCVQAGTRRGADSCAGGGGAAGAVKCVGGGWIDAFGVRSGRGWDGLRRERRRDGRSARSRWGRGQPGWQGCVRRLESERGAGDPCARAATVRWLRLGAFQGTRRFGLQQPRHPGIPLRGRKGGGQPGWQERVPSPTLCGVIATFARDPSGGLTFTSCIQNTGSGTICASTGGNAPGLSGAVGVTVSSDGQNVYVASLGGSLAVLKRDAIGGLSFGGCF